MSRQPISVLDTGAICAYKGAVRCRILKVNVNIFGKPRTALVNFGGGVPFLTVPVTELTRLRGETSITPTRGED